LQRINEGRGTGRSFGLRGHFSAVIAGGDDTAALVSDPAGSRRLYYAVDGDRLLFASEYKAILPCLDSEVEPGRAALLHVHSTLNGCPDTSCIEGVKRVPAGHQVRWSENGGEPDVTEYRALPSGGARSPADADEAVDALIEGLDFAADVFGGAGG
jgi:asparagine synthetase B (glutamine-hydrolysing)